MAQEQPIPIFREKLTKASPTSKGTKLPGIEGVRRGSRFFNFFNIAQ